MDVEAEPAMKEFKQVNENLEVLEKYEGDLREDYRNNWVKNPYKAERGSIINHEEVLYVAEEMGETDMMKVEEIATMLEFGADIGVETEGRWPSNDGHSAF